MTEYELLSTAATPRDPRTARRLARRLDPVEGFRIHGFLWIYASLAVAVFAARAVAWAMGSGESIVLHVVLFVLAYMLFPAWVWRRIGAARRLFRDGTFVDATVTTVRHSYMGRGLWRTPATIVNLHLTADGKKYLGLSLFGHVEGIKGGDILPLLCVPGYTYCAVFPGRGELVVGRQHNIPGASSTRPPRKESVWGRYF
ncbi:hypothetical protein [Sorangium sp. So ce854]|uniref:hypothetical protein n=1 Tax=Sorangium sp. So ce854 TaxID=3133322 RepID=UPI003F629997